ncbi:tetrahydrofolate dehydrogenase/cyclohydrolase catalytic domain-containing protein [Patescibacteria group bacterium]
MIIFDGKTKAHQIESTLRGRSSGKQSKVLRSIVVGDQAGAMKYQHMKKAAAERVGASLVIDHFDDDSDFETIKTKILELNTDSQVDGIMIQLPLPKILKNHTDALIKLIEPQKDVDGMRSDSPYTAPVVKAITIALRKAEKSLNQNLKDKKTLVVGSSGFVGKKLVKHLAENKYAVVGVDDASHIDPYTKTADVIISITGVPDLIGPDQIQEGVILIDVGAPNGDIEKKAYERASYVSPVPGGIGPVTIACLLENLIL